MGRKLTDVEKGAIIGFIVGLMGLAGSYFLNVGFEETICITTFEPAPCLRYVSIVPFFFILFGIVLGLIIKNSRKRDFRGYSQT